MPNERSETVLLDVLNTAAEIYDKIIDRSPMDSGKRVIGFGVFMQHEDGTLATDVCGYFDAERCQSRMNNVLNQFALKQLGEFTGNAFRVDENNQPTVDNQTARPALWKGF